MNIVIEPADIAGSIAAPPSKSHTQRAYAAALLHKGKTILHHAGNSDDEKAALQVIQQLGAKVMRQTDTMVEIVSNGLNPLSDAVTCGESGLSARLFTPIAALCDRAITIEGTGSLLKRPMDDLLTVLKELNVSITGFNGYLPFTVQGTLVARPFSVDAASGSQALSGLLFALSTCAAQPLTIEVTNLKSIPYIDLTLEVLAHFGKPIRHHNYKEFYIDPGLFTHSEVVEINIEADWSSAAYLLVAGAIAGSIAVQNLQTASCQADKIILDVLRSAGAALTIEKNSVSVKRTNLQAFDFDATHCPDLFPVLAILAACCGGESSIAGVHRLFHKESNRVESITEMLQDFAVPWSVEEDMLFITGVPHLQGTIIDSYHDHRIVMAAAIGALRANGPVDITFVESVNKSYPGFFKDLILCGGKCNFNNNL